MQGYSRVILQLRIFKPYLTIGGSTTLRRLNIYKRLLRIYISYGKVEGSQLELITLFFKDIIGLLVSPVC